MALLLFLHQDLDTPYSDDAEIPNPEGRRTRQRSLVLQIDQGWTPRFASRLVVPARDISASGQIEFDSAGLGDIEAWGRVRLGGPLSRWNGAVGAGLAAPTGRDADPDTVDENIIFGAGSTSLLLSSEASRSFAHGQTFFAMALYRRPLGSGDTGLRLGDDLGWSLAWQWTPRKGEARASLMLGLSGQHLGQDQRDGEPVASRGGRMHYLSGGFTVSLGKRGALSLFAQHLVERQVRGDQLLAPWNLGAAYSIGWGGS